MSELDKPTVATDSTAPRKTYEGNCHCGAVRYSLVYPSLDQIEVGSCDCSICSTNGYLMIYPLRTDFTYTRGEEFLTGYSFGSKNITHYFCKVCGSSMVGDFPEHPILAVNVRTLKGVDVADLKLKYNTRAKHFLPAYEIGP